MNKPVKTDSAGSAPDAAAWQAQVTALNREVETLRRELLIKDVQIQQLRSQSWLVPADKAIGETQDRINVNGIEIAWDTRKGICTFRDLPVALMWVDTTLAGLMAGMVAMVGPERFALALQAEGRKSVESDWMLITRHPSFREGFADLANNAAIAAWGNWQLIAHDEARRQCRFEVHNNWEGLYQKALGVCWGSGLLAGKLAGICSKLFNTNCWARQTKFVAKGDEFDEFVVEPSERSLENEVADLWKADQATRADMAASLKQLQAMEASLREQIVKHQQTVRELNDARVATLNLMEDAIADRNRAEAARAALEREVIQRQLAEKSLQLQTTALNAAANAIWITDREGKVEWVNPAFTKLTGYTLPEAIGKTPRDLVRSGQQDKSFYQNLWNTILAGQVWRGILVNRRKDGSHYTEEETITPVMDATGQVTHFIAVKENISARRQAEATLRLESAALEAAANAIVITNREGVIEWVNTAFTTVTGYGAGEAVGQNPRLLKSAKHDREFYRNLWETIRAGKPWVGEMINRRKDGSLYHDEMTITPLKDERGEITHYIAVKQDITKRKLLEEEFRQSQKMEAFGQLAGGVAHDFNNILGAIIMQANVTGMDENLPAEVQEGLRQIRADADRAANLTRQLLLFSRKQVTQTRELDINEVVTNLVKMLQRIIGEDISLTTDLQPSGAPVRADLSMIEQVLVNLAVNARDAMPSGGKLELAVHRMTLDEAAAAGHPRRRPGDFIRVSVADNGVGIMPEILPHIFEPFFTTKDVGKGSGLGLATVHGILEQHCGWVEVSSQVGKGTVFHVYLPRLAEPAKKLPEVESPSEVIGGKETILLVEDEPTLRTILTRALKQYGYTVLMAESGTMAMELWRQHRQSVNLLLTDVIMPDGVSGSELAVQLQADQPGLKVLYMSGYSGEIAGQGLDLREGVNFIPKPFSAVKLAKIIRKCLGDPPP